MARKTKTKQKSLEQVVAERLASRVRDFAAVGLQPSSACLSTNDAIVVERESRNNAERARRLDAFEALKPSLKDFPGAYDAARRLEDDILTRMGEGDRGRAMSRVDCEVRDDKIDLMRAAGKRVDEVVALLPDRDAWLLTEIINPSIPYPNWRTIVAKITGEINESAQGAAVRASCINLREAYGKIERKKKVAA